MSLGIFEWVYVAGFVAGSVIRGIFRAQTRQNRVALDRKSVLDLTLTSLMSIGMFILPGIYLATPWLDLTDYHLPNWAGWLGAAIFAAGLWLLYRSHADLGRNWSVSLEVFEGHTLVTGGVFKHIRHPMYAAHLLWFVAQPLLLQNWIVGFSSLVLFFPMFFTRVPHEEQMMLEQFGDAYREYMQRTGRVIPKLRQ